MKAYLSAIFTILWKDFLLEVRTKEVVTPILVFVFLVIITFNFAFEPTPALLAVVSAGTLWVSFTFAGVLGLNRTFAMEKEKGGLDGLLLTPVSRDALYFGKLLSAFFFMLAIEFVMLPVFGILFNLPLFLPSLWLLTVLTTLGFAAVGTVFSAMAVNMRAREVLLPVLFFPIVLPVIIAAVESTSAIFAGAGAGRAEDWSEFARWLQLTAAFDAVFLVVSAALFQFVVQE
ncbi:MAG: heme ABC transporter permease CcmB [Dehalococcoidia bacterium]|nr:heme ABC transporter permease CcmB [Dehalococcoidia bacterium]